VALLDVDSSGGELVAASACGTQRRQLTAINCEVSVAVDANGKVVAAATVVGVVQVRVRVAITDDEPYGLLLGLGLGVVLLDVAGGWCLSGEFVVNARGEPADRIRAEIVRRVSLSCGVDGFASRTIIRH
jgi:hypothetical protein